MFISDEEAVLGAGLVSTSQEFLYVHLLTSKKIMPGNHRLLQKKN